MALRWFRCPVCQTRVSTGAAKRTYKPGHVKSMWCWKCKKVRPFVMLKARKRR